MAIRKINIWVNGSPGLDEHGREYFVAPRKNIDTVISIIPGEGGNRIEVSVINSDSAESIRTVINAMHISALPPKERIYFIGLGIDVFAESGHGLHWSVKDIRDLAARFSRQEAIIDTLFNERLTRGNVQALRKRLLQTTENDKVIVAYSGHGLIDSNYNYFLSTYDVSFKDPSKNGIPYSEIEELFTGIRARRKLLLLDACNSGEFDKTEYKRYMDARDSLTRNRILAQPDLASMADRARYGLSSGLELMQNAFIDVGFATGTNVIAAAAGTQLAIAAGDAGIENGVFTHVILEIMNSRRAVTVNELREIVSARVREITKGIQTPTARNAESYYDWEVW